MAAKKNGKRKQKKRRWMNGAPFIVGIAVGAVALVMVLMTVLKPLPKVDAQTVAPPEPAPMTAIAETDATVTEAPAATQVPTPEPTPVSYDTSMQEMILRMWRQDSKIAASVENSAWVSGGQVKVIGSNESGQRDTADWTNVVAVKLGDAFAMGLTDDGRVLFAGNNDFGQCNLDPGEKKVVSIEASARASYAVLEDGTVMMSGSGVISNTDLLDVANAAVISVDESHALVLRRDGTAIMPGVTINGFSGIREWKNLVAVSSGNGVVIALDKNGNVYVAGDTRYGQNALNGIEKAHGVAAGGNFAVAIVENGDVKGAGSNSRGQIDVGEWHDVRSVACGYMHAVALTKDGELLFTGTNDKGQCG